MNRIALVAALALLVGGCNSAPAGKGQPDDPAWQKANAAKNADAPDASKAPGTDEPERLGAGPAGAFNLRSNQVRTRHLFDGSVTAGKMANVAVTVTVAAAASTGSSAASTALAGGFLVGCTPAGNQDQFISNAVLNADGSITVTLKAAATAINTFRCVAVKPNSQGIS